VRADSTSRARSARFVDHRSASETVAVAAFQPPPAIAFSSSRRISGATHVGACTPLVIDPIGTSRSSNDGHSPANMPRLTSPCRVLTPFARDASRSPMTAMLKTDRSPPS
jgi:hypothetical protein